MVRSGSVFIEQSIRSPSNKDTTTTYYDSSGDQIGDPFHASSVATSTIDSEGDNCEQSAAATGDLVGEKVSSALADAIITGATLEGGTVNLT